RALAVLRAILKPERLGTAGEDAHAEAGDGAVPEHGLAGCGLARAGEAFFGELPGHGVPSCLTAHRQHSAPQFLHGAVRSTMAGYAEKTSEAGRMAAFCLARCGEARFAELAPPKAEVTSSNLVGRASSVVESKWPELAHKPPP